MANRRPVTPTTSGHDGSGQEDSASERTSRFSALRTPKDAGAETKDRPASGPTFASSGTAPAADKREAKSRRAEKESARDRAEPASKRSESPKGSKGSKAPNGDAKPAARTSSSTDTRPISRFAPRTNTARPAAPAARTRSARLRLTHVDPWSVMKIAFLLSIALGIVAIVAVTIIWGVLGAAGVWDSINASVQKTVGSTSKPFNITDYVGTGRVVGFTMIASVIDVIVLTALATLGAFVYNLAATLLGGLEMTFAEDR